MRMHKEDHAFGTKSFGGDAGNYPNWGAIQVSRIFALLLPVTATLLFNLVLFFCFLSKECIASRLLDATFYRTQCL